MPRLAQQHFSIAKEQRIARHHQVGIGDLRMPLRSIGAVQHDGAQGRSEPLHLRVPVRHDAGRSDDERRPVQASSVLLGKQVRQRLDGFAEAHRVCQDAAESERAQPLQPTQSIALVRAQLGAQ